MKNIGIITSGGDCGGLNAVIRGAARTALMRGMRTYTIPNGYAGLYNLVNFLVKDGKFVLDRNDEIVQKTLVCIDGQLVHQGAREAMGL